MKRKYQRKKNRAYQAAYHADRRLVDRLFNEMYQEMRSDLAPLKDLFAHFKDELPDEVHEAVEAFNRGVSGITLSWSPGKTRLALASLE